MGPNDPFAGASQSAARLRAETPASPWTDRLPLPTQPELRPHLAAASVGMSLGLAVLLVGWTGLVTVLVCGMGAVSISIAVQWARHRLNFGAAFRALTKRE